MMHECHIRVHPISLSPSPASNKFETTSPPPGGEVTQWAMSLGPYRPNWRSYAGRVAIGLMIATSAAAVFAILEMLLVWVVAIPLTAYVVLFVFVWIDQSRGNKRKYVDE